MVGELAVNVPGFEVFTVADEDEISIVSTMFGIMLVLYIELLDDVIPFSMLIILSRAVVVESCILLIEDVVWSISYPGVVSEVPDELFKKIEPAFGISFIMAVTVAPRFIGCDVCSLFCIRSVVAMGSELMFSMVVTVVPRSIGRDVCSSLSSCLFEMDTRGGSVIILLPSMGPGFGILFTIAVAVGFDVWSMFSTCLVETDTSGGLVVILSSVSICLVVLVTDEIFSSAIDTICSLDLVSCIKVGEVTELFIGLFCPSDSE